MNVYLIHARDTNRYKIGITARTIELSHQARAIPLEPKENRKRKLEIMGQSVQASRQCRALIEELKKLQAA